MPNIIRSSPGAVWYVPFEEKENTKHGCQSGFYFVNQNHHTKNFSCMSMLKITDGLGELEWLCESNEPPNACIIYLYLKHNCENIVVEINKTNIGHIYNFAQVNGYSERLYKTTFANIINLTSGLPYDEDTFKLKIGDEVLLSVKDLKAPFYIENPDFEW